MSKVHSIEELERLCAEKNMPLEKMRFFIGRDMKEPKCFGVYQDEKTGDWIVYKNKANGERAIRYAGPDEARAAQEIWDKIGDEIKLRKDRYANPYEDSVYRSLEPEEPKSFPERVLSFPARIINFIKGHLILSFFALWLAVFIIVQVFFPGHKQGYYQVEDATYYCLSGNWYQYYDDSWIMTTIPEENIDDFYLGSTYSPSYGTSNFENTHYYEEYLEEKNNDDDHDYDFDTWDAGDTDWDSDW